MTKTAKFAILINREPVSPGNGQTYAAYDDRRIWGIGANKMAARQAARTTVYIYHGADEISQRTSVLDIAPITDRLKAKLQSHNEAEYVLLEDGHLDLRENLSE